MMISKGAVIQLLLKYKCEKFGDYLDHEVWITPDQAIIRLPKTSQIHIDIVETICIDVLQMGNWGYDYWLGEIGIN
jgi:hypothetical protein